QSNPIPIPIPTPVHLARPRLSPADITLCHSIRYNRFLQQVAAGSLPLQAYHAAYAMEQGLLFMPRVGKFYNGMPTL
ncbi:hypothetical protein ACJX0J_016622, partial [Zea mays]